MAAESPFGSSFGDPRKYMGQSPLAEAGQLLKRGLTGYALQKSGFTDFLNGLNKKPVSGAVAPAGVAPTAVQPPQQGIAPMMPIQQPAMDTESQPDEMPADIGEQILDNRWNGAPSLSKPSAPISLNNPTDFNPLAPDASNQFAVSGNDYQQVPGYGKLQKIASQIFGMG